MEFCNWLSKKSNKKLKWKNHEKILIIDNIIGYSAGLDLSERRYDNNKHPIFKEPNTDNAIYNRFVPLFIYAYSPDI